MRKRPGRCRVVSFRVGALCGLGLLLAARASAGDLILGCERKLVDAMPTLSERRSLRPKRVTKPPRLDGRLNDPCWRDAPVTGGLRLKAGSRHGAAFPKKTLLQAAYDDAYLYLAFQAFDPDMPSLLAKYTERDDKYWLDDDIEIMIDPNYDRLSFYQFLFNAAEGKGDYVCWFQGFRTTAEASYNPDWRLKTRKYPDRWVAELALPFRIFGLDGVRPGDRWGFNFCRIENPSGMLGNWTPATNHRDPRLFGDMIFGRSDYALGEVDMGARARGVNLMRAAVTNNTKAPRELELAALVSTDAGAQTRHATARTVAPGRTATFLLSYAVPWKGSGVKVEAQLRDPAWSRVVAQRVNTVDPKPALSTRIESVELFEADKEARVGYAAHVGRATATTGSLRVELRKRGAKAPSARQSLAPMPTGERTLRVNVAGLKAGEYELRIALLDDKGRPLAERRVAFAKSESLMDF